MSITHKVTKRTSNQIEFEITVPKDLIEEPFEQVYNEHAGHVQVKGFRPGKAPRAMIIEQVGVGRLIEETLHRLVRQSFQASITDEKVLPVGQPEIQIKQWSVSVDGQAEKELKLNCQTAIMPDIELGDYTKLKLPKDFKIEPDSVGDSDIDAVLNHLRRQKATPKETEKSHQLQQGDLAVITYTGTINGRQIDQLANNHYPVVVGAGSLIDEFERELIGETQGAKKTFTITLPETTREKELAGQKATFAVTIDEVKQLELPKLDDSFASSFGVKDLATLRGQITENLVHERTQAKQHDLEHAVIEEALKLLRVDLPDALADEEVERMMKRLSHESSKRGLPLPIYLEKMKKTESDARAEFRPQAIQNVRSGLLLGEIIKKEGIDLKDDQAPKKAVEKLVEIAKKNSNKPLINHELHKSH